MSIGVADISLPLLARELTELAARRRTYVVRVLYAFILLFCGWLAFHATTTGLTGSFAFLGSGAVLLWWMGYLQNVGMLVVLPALSCDVFTREKERQTISLLFMTRLTPPLIVLEKFLSRLFPAVCLLLISLPLLAFSYSLGGVEAWQVTNVAFGLLTNAITLTAIAMACSALCHSTTAAFMWTYALVLITPLMVISGRANATAFDFVLFGRYFNRALYLDAPGPGSRFGTFLPGATTSPLMMSLNYLVQCLPSLVFAAFYLVIARRFLVSRATRQPKTPSRWLSALRQFRRGRRSPLSEPEPELVIDHSPWLDTKPVAWRETYKRWLGRPWPNVLLGAFLLLIVAYGGWLTNYHSYYSQPHRIVLITIGLVLWTTMLFALTVATANLITQERGQQTLFVLLTTPLSGSEIIRQKLAGIRRLLWTFLIPLSICLVTRMTLAMPTVHRRNSGKIDYPLALLNESTMLVIYPQVVIWMALYYSLKSKTTIAAIMKTVLTIALQCILPWLLLLLFALAMGGLPESTYFFVMLLLMVGPADLLLYGYAADCIPPGFDDSIIPVIVNSLIHGFIWFRLRRKCLNEADRLLGRSQG